MKADELLTRIAATLRHEVGPAVEGEYPKTQAFMASVILERVARELGSSAAHRSAEEADMAALVVELQSLLAGAPEDVSEAFGAVGSAVADLGPLISSLYGWDDPAAGQALAAIRPVLRHDLDRRMEVAR